MLSRKTIGVIGCGNMGEALVRGLLNMKVVAASAITASTPREQRRAFLKKEYKINVTASNVDVVKKSDILILAVKPQILHNVIREIARHVSKKALVISVAAGITAAAIEKSFGKNSRVVRVMPNVPALVGAAATGISGGVHATKEDMEVTQKIFDAVGSSYVVDEYLMDGVTGLSGSGPAYVFLIIEALSDAGVKVGIPRHIAQPLAAQTVMGAAKLLIDTGMHPGRLKDMVTSPGGTAIAGLHTLEEGGLRTTIMNAVEDATHRSIELGQKLHSK